MSITNYATEPFPEKGARTVQVAFKDETDAAVIPNAGTITWTLYNRPSDPDEAPTVVNSREDETVTSASTINILLEGDDLAFLTTETGTTIVRRALVISYQYDSSLGDNIDDKIQYLFDIERIYGVS